MRADLIDERDTSWESDIGEFRVTYYANRSGPSTLKDFTSTETFAICDGSFSDAQRWAAQHAHARPYRLGVVIEAGTHGRGVVWLTATT